jgi:hypothetical protein
VPLWGTQPLSGFLLSQPKFHLQDLNTLFEATLNSHSLDMTVLLALKDSDTSFSLSVVPGIELRALSLASTVQLEPCPTLFLLVSQIRSCNSP